MKTAKPLLLCFLALLPLQAWACSCAVPQPEYDHAAAVAVVSVVGAEPDKEAFSNRAFRLKVQRSWKIRLPKEITVLTQAGASLSCGYPLVLNETYLLYLYGGKNGNFNIAACMGTGNISAGNTVRYDKIFSEEDIWFHRARDEIRWQNAIHQLEQKAKSIPPLP
ncbi:MAG: hypothetical protein LBU53_07320 [Zoogloeaceae bacterium]|jgi:hypothetical protein|nr:hypothetical protein [Zoogloeaceae bacterium]